MWSFFSVARVRQLSVFWSAFILVGLFVSAWVRVWPSIGIAGLFLTSVGYALNQRAVAQRSRWPELLSFLLVYAVHLATGFMHGSLADSALRQDLVLQLPFVLLPLSFLLLPDWQAWQVRSIWLLLIGTCLVAAAAATANYVLHNKEIEQLYLQSKVMPTEPDHIRFSLLISIAIIAGATLIGVAGLVRWQRIGVLAAMLLLFMFQHLLAVRSGIVTMYAAGIAGLFWLGWYQKRWMVAAGAALGAIVVGACCLLLFPTLQNKVANTRTDAAQMESVKAANNFSMTARVYSYQAAWTIIKKHPLLGVSKVRLADEMAQEYSYRYPEIEPDRYVLPHNQFIYNLAAYGILGLLVFILGYYYTLFIAIAHKNMLLMLVYLIITISFVAEYTLESNIGVIVGLFFMLLAAATPLGLKAASSQALGS